jgi:pilus assembly protein Flp/PilA
MLLKRFIEDENGATAIEYALIGTLISLAIISGMGLIADQVQRMFSDVQEGFEP